MSDGYLSGDREHLTCLQRERRARIVRIDYMPSPAALPAIDAKCATLRPGSIAATKSAVLDAIVSEWAKMAGQESCGGASTEISDRTLEFGNQYAPTRVSPVRERSAPSQEFGTMSGVTAAIPRALTRAYDFGRRAAEIHEASEESVVAQHITCGARRHRDDQPCQAKSEPGKRRCRFHGGCSTGPKTAAGRKRALRNLKQFKHKT